MIRVLHVVSNLSVSSGVMSMLMNYYRNDIKRQFIFGFLYYDERPNTFEQEIINLGGKVYRICRPTDFVEFKKRTNEVAALITNQYDIIHLHEFFTPVFFKRLQVKARIPQMIVHAHVSKYSDEGIFRSIRNKLFELPNRFCVDKYFAASYEAGKSIFGKKFDSNGVIIRNAIDLERFNPNASIRSQVRKELGVDDKYVIGHVGNFYPPKNHSFIIDVFRETLKKRNDAILVLVGDGPLRKEIEKYAADIIDKVIMLGLHTDTENYYRTFDKFVFPSKFEGLGLAMIEAQACGVSCVFSDTIPKEANILKDSNTCLSLFDETEVWCNALLQRRKIEDSSVFEQISIAGYNISDAVDNLVRAYENVID